MSDELKLFDGIRKFLCEYLPIQRSASLHTVSPTFHVRTRFQLSPKE